MEVAKFILECIEILAVIIVGLIFRSQIKSQNNIIEKMKTYSDIIDVNEIKQYSELMVEKAKLTTERDVLKFLEQELSSGAYDDRLNDKMNRETFNEHLGFSLFFLSKIDKAERRKIANTFFPKSGDSLLRVVDKHTNTL